MNGGCNFERRKKGERERESLRERKRRKREKSGLIESLNLEQPKVGYPAHLTNKLSAQIAVWPNKPVFGVHNYSLS